MTSIAASLGIGSGLDINAMVTGLADAAKQPKLDLLTKRDTANKAKISMLGQVRRQIAAARSRGAQFGGELGEPGGNLRAALLGSRHQPLDLLERGLQILSGIVHVIHSF